METEQLTSVGGLMQESMMSPMHGFDALGSNSVDESLSPPDPFRIPLLTFTAPASGTETVSWNAGGTVVVHWGDGTSDTGLGHTYTGLTPGEQVTISLESTYNFGFTANSALKSLENLTFWWDGIANTQNTLNLKNTGINRRMTPTMDNTYGTLNLEGNSIEGQFPPGITVSSNCFIKDNKLTGNLPAIGSNIKKYQVQGNAFTGDIHDISNYTQIEAYLAYGQDNGNTYSRVNPKIMLTGTIPDLSTCPSLTFYHVGAGEPWNRGFKNNLSLASDFDIGVNMERFYASNCQLSTEEIDKILNKFAAKAGSFTTPNIIELSGSNGYPTSAGLADTQTLITDGWTVNLPALD
jgi:hypothetical protein